MKKYLPVSQTFVHCSETKEDWNESNVSKETLCYRVQMKHTIFGLKALIGLIGWKECAPKVAKIKHIQSDFSQIWIMICISNVNFVLTNNKSLIPWKHSLRKMRLLL